jgi:hypothetical protein
MPTFEIAGDRSGRTFRSLAETEAAIESDRQEAIRRQKETWRREREYEARRGVELERQRWEAQRARIEVVLTEARSGLGQSEATMREAIAGGHLEDAVATALRLTALPVVLEAVQAELAAHIATRPAFVDEEPTPS